MDHAVALTFKRYLDNIHTAIDGVSLASVTAIVACLYEAYRADQKVLIAGNGGSASTASHMAANLSKTIFGRRPDPGRRRFKVLALADNIPTLTAWANDTDYDRVFAEQVQTLIDPGDVLIVISGSGKSPNIVEAVKTANRLGATTIGLLGAGGGEIKDLAHHALIVASDDYGPIEDVHLMLNHIFTACLRELIARERSPSDC